MNEWKGKKRYAAAGILAAALCIFAALAGSGLYRKLMPKEREKITIGVFSDSYWEVQNGYSYQILNDAIEKFQEDHPGIRADYVSGVLKEDYSEWLTGKLLSQKAPDVFFILGDDFNILANSGALKDLSHFMETDGEFRKEDFYSSALFYGEYDGRQYALPYECAPKLMFVNRTILDGEGIPMPSDNWTWDDFYKICRQVTKDTDGDGLTDQFGAVGYTWMEAFDSNGVRLFDQNGTKCDFTAPGIDEALKFMERLEGLNAGYNVSEHDFDLGKAVFRPMSFSEFRAYKPYPLSIKKYSSFDWGCIPMPSGPQGDNISTLDTLLVGINADTANEKAAWDFIKILTCDPEIQAEIFDYSEGVSVLREVTESEQTLKRLMEDSGNSQSLNLSILSEAVENSLASPEFPGFEEAAERVGQAVEAILDGNGNINMEQIIWNREINKYLEER